LFPINMFADLNGCVLFKFFHDDFSLLEKERSRAVHKRSRKTSVLYAPIGYKKEISIYRNLIYCIKLNLT
jgi:hypothetical protein